MRELLHKVREVKEPYVLSMTFPSLDGALAKTCAHRTLHYISRTRQCWIPVRFHAPIVAEGVARARLITRTAEATRATAAYIITYKNSVALF